MGIEVRRGAFPTEDWLQMATEAAAVGVWDMTLPTNELHWSNRCNEIFGLPLDAQLTYAEFLERVHLEDRPRVDQVVQTVFDPAGTGDYDLEYRVVRPNGEIRWVAARGKAQFRQQQDGRRVAYRFMGTLLDRTEQKQTQQALLEAEKLAVIGRLAAAIAHDIRNPLHAIGDLLYLIEGESSQQARSQHIASAREELGRAAHIASDTLRFYRDPAMVGETANATEMIDSALAVLQGRIRQCDVRLRTRVEPGVSLHMSPGEIRQVLINLLSNALDALRPCGQLYVRLHRTPLSGNGAVLLTVADTGSGMSPEVRSRVFEAFYTTKQDKGTGIGLWLSLEILKKYQCSVRVKSAVGRGTVFSLFLSGR